VCLRATIDDEEESGLERSVALGHERSCNGCVPKMSSVVLVPMRPKDGFGVTGIASWRMYHQVLTFPKRDA
jgi:hypothetical protein